MRLTTLAYWLALGLPWSASFPLGVSHQRYHLATRPPPLSALAPAWRREYQELLEFHAEFGHADVPLKLDHVQSRLDDLDATTTASHRAIEAKLDKLIGLLSNGGRAA